MPKVKITSLRAPSRREKELLFRLNGQLHLLYVKELNATTRSQKETHTQTEQRWSDAKVISVVGA